MKVDKADAALFFQLWFPLLDYVNRKYHIRPEIKKIDQQQGINLQDGKAIANYLWANIRIIDEYLAVADLPDEHVQIISEWKRCRRDEYVLERHLKKGSVFISTKDETVYMVQGLFSTWEEMLGEAPMLVDTALLPFKGGIVSDGLVSAFNVCLGKGVREAYKEIYMTAKGNNAIHFSL